MPTRPRPFTGLLLGSLLVLAVACAPSVAPSVGPDDPPSLAPAPTASPAPGSVGSGTPAPSPTPGTGFAFSADAVLGFYESAGFACDGPQPSTSADGWTSRTCERTDDAGQRLGVGVVTDPQGALGDGFASVTAARGEDFLRPADALDHLSGFLGAMLGDARATAQLPWLAGSMGNEYEEVTDGDLRVATYLQPKDDPRTIWLEVAGPDYMATPAP